MNFKKLMKRIGTKNLQEQEDLSIPSLGFDIADKIQDAVGFLNDKEDVMQEEIARITDTKILKEVEKNLGKSLVSWLMDNYSNPSLLNISLASLTTITDVTWITKSVEDYTADNVGDGKIPSIFTSLKKLGILNQRSLGKEILVSMKQLRFTRSSYNSKGGYYYYAPPSETYATRNKDIETTWNSDILPKIDMDADKPTLQRGDIKHTNL
jgi:hypothetical protein